MDDLFEREWGDLLPHIEDSLRSGDFVMRYAEDLGRHTSEYNPEDGSLTIRDEQGGQVTLEALEVWLLCEHLAELDTMIMCMASAVIGAHA
jgi:hypothetical protein